MSTIARDVDRGNTYLLDERIYIHDKRRSGKVAANNASLEKLRGADNVPVIRDFLVEEGLQRGNNDNTT